MEFKLKKKSDNEKLVLAKHMISCYLSSREALKTLKILRSERNLQGDYAEWLVSSYLNLELSESGVEKGFDAIDKDGFTYQVKSRIISHANRSNKNTSFDIKNINYKFDYLICLFFEAESFEVIGIVKIPYETVKDLGSPTKTTFRFRWNKKNSENSRGETLFWKD